MASSKAARDGIAEGRRSSHTICTMRRPVSQAMAMRARNRTGMARAPLSVIPGASAMAVIALAVPMVLQCPRPGAEAQTRPMNSSRSILPSASRRRRSRTMDPEPASLPFHQPSGIGPPVGAIAGRLTVAAPIRMAGLVLSQPVLGTTKSMG